MLKTGVIGAVLTAICCLTPLLPVLLGAAGLGGLTALVHNDLVLLPLLALFLALAVWGYRKRK